MPDKALAAGIQKLRDDPTLFAREILGVDWWAKQDQMARALCENNRVAVKACHSSGKTYSSACLALWFLTTHTPSIVITTAPTNRQVEELLWREMRNAYHKAKVPLGGRFYDIPKWNLTDTEYALGLSTKDPNAFQGHHSENLLVIVDEAAGVAENIFDAIEGLLSTQKAKLLLIGNPTSQSGTFYNAFHKSRALYYPMTISYKDTPNFIPSERRRPYLISPEWVEERRKDWGEDSPLWYARVLGEFPVTGTDTFIPLQWVEAAMARWYEMPDGEPCEMGVDVAWRGDDETVFCIRRGGKVLPLIHFRGIDPMQTTGEAIRLQREYIIGNIKVDGIGIGSGVVTRLREQQFHAMDIQSAAHASNREKYSNLRCEMWDGFRERLRAGEVGLPPDEELAGQLCGMKYRPPNSRGQLVLETKAEMRDRCVDSPDRADAVVYAFAALTTTPLAQAEMPVSESRWGQDGREEGTSRWRS